MFSFGSVRPEMTIDAAEIEALESTLGQRKTDAVARRLLDINPDLIVHPVFGTYDAAHREAFFPAGASYDYIADAIDTVSAKIELICRAKAAGTPIISAMGAGNKLDPSAFRVADLAKTQGCPLARIMRRELKKRGVHKQEVVFSEEVPVDVGQRTPASMVFVPAAAGMLLASRAVDFVRNGR